VSDFEDRRARVVVQVVARWTGIDLNDDPDVEAKAMAAANAAFMARPKTNDLDWEAATLRRVGYEGPTL
jgi:alkylhydroperoxidase family enzyme